MHCGKRLVVSERAIHRSKIISEFEDGRLKRSEASQALGLSERQVSRLATGWRKRGVLGIEHQNAGKVSPRKTPDEIRERIEFLAQEKYVNFNYQHFHELLVKEEKITVSYSTVKRICTPLGIAKKSRRRKKIRRRRNRVTCAGLMVQMDGSDHAWVKGKNWCLIAPIDDATSEVAYGEFFETEHLQGYLAVLRRLIELKGIPRILYVDHASWLSGTAKNDESGQFKRLCEELGITLLFANSPQAKGRVERLWQTFQDRLVAEFRYHRITTMQEANLYLNTEFLPKTWNEKFTVLAKSSKSSYQPIPTGRALDEVFCYKYKRKVRNDHTILWGNRLYQIDAKLSHSIAKHEIEMRIYQTGLIKGYYAGKDLELMLVERIEDRDPKGLVTGTLRPAENPSNPTGRGKSTINIYT